MTQPAQYISGRTVQEQMDQLIGYVDTRAAEVATDAIASDVAQVHQDMLDADADASAAAASAAAAAGTLANAVKKTGEASQSIAGDIAVAGDLTGGTVTVPAPVNNTDAASKKYVDDADALKMNINDVNSYAVGMTGNQSGIGGVKGFNNGISAFDNDWNNTYADTGSINDIKLFAKLKNQGPGKFLTFEFIQKSNTAPVYGILIMRNSSSPIFGWAVRAGFGTNNPLTANSILIASDGANTYLASRKVVPYGSLNVRVKHSLNYGVVETNPSPQIEWLNAAVNIGDGTGYTLTEVTP